MYLIYKKEIKICLNYKIVLIGSLYGDAVIGRYECSLVVFLPNADDKLRPMKLK